MATVKALVVAGGGAGGNWGGGGGGAGGFLYDAALTVTAQAYTVTVGNGGAKSGAPSFNTVGASGGNSVFDTLTSIGGGYGASAGGVTYGNAANGGSGGGAGYSTSDSPTAGTGTGGQGNNGGANESGNKGGGGGGASAAGVVTSGNGGAGTANSISGASVTYAGGGGRGARSGVAAGSGGAGGGGAGAAAGGGTNGTANTGGGGGAGFDGANAGGDGGSGIVIISYATDGSDGVSTSSSGGTVTTSGGNTIHTFTSSGTFTCVLAGAAGFKKATVNASDVPATQTNFPSYVDLSRLGITTLAEAQSVRVYADSAKTTEWAREIVSATEMHVKVPSLTSTVEMFVEWDGVSADYAVTDTYGRNNVWTGYRAVYHFDGVTDSTASGITLTNRNSVAFSSGLMGDEANFGATNTTKQLYTTTTEMLNKTEIVANWTSTFWINPADLSARTVFTIFYADDGASKKMAQLLYDPTTSQKVTFYWVGSTLLNYYTNYTPTTGVRTKLTFSVGTSGALNIYANGSNILSTTIANFNSRGDNVGSAYGYQLSGEFSGSLFVPFKGDMDENRIRLSAITANWETTEYNNQSDEAGFWGTWSDVGGATFIPRASFFM